MVHLIGLKFVIYIIGFHRTLPIDFDELGLIASFIGVDKRILINYKPMGSSY